MPKTKPLGRLTSRDAIARVLALLGPGPTDFAALRAAADVAEVALQVERLAPPRRRPKAEDWRAKMIGFAAKTGLSIEEACRRSGISRPTFYLMGNAGVRREFVAIRARTRTTNQPAAVSRSRDARTGERQVEESD